MMRLLLFFAAVGLGFGLVSLGVRAYPALAVRAHFVGIDRMAGGTHQILHAPLPDASFRHIVKPSPDLLYSTFTYDLDDGPLYVRLPEHEGSWVAQVMDVSGDTVGYLRAGDELAVLALEDQKLDARRESVVRVSAPRGAVLVRYLVESPEKLHDLEARRKTIEVRNEPWKP